MYRVGVRCKMDVGHYLIGDFGDESVPHRHDYVAEWVCRRAELDENGFSVDIAAMEACLAETADTVADTLLNEHEFFEQIQPSVENFARFLYDQLAVLSSEHGLPGDVMAGSEVVVWENENAWASYADETPV